jgi:hypothetical protein
VFIATNKVNVVQVAIEIALVFILFSGAALAIRTRTGEGRADAAQDGDGAAPGQWALAHELVAGGGGDELHREEKKARGVVFAVAVDGAHAAFAQFVDDAVAPGDEGAGGESVFGAGSEDTRACVRGRGGPKNHLRA